jgi:diguanylate cyclase (GGDEF)-like protein
MLINMLSRIVELGVTSDGSASLNRQVRLINQVCLVCIFAIFSHLVVTLGYGLAYPSWVQLGAILLLWLAIVLNARGYIGTARVLALVVGNLHIFNMVLLLGLEGGVYFYYPLCLISPLFFYSNDEWRYYVSFVCFTIFLAVLNHIIARYRPPLVEAPESLLVSFFYLSLVASMVTIFGFTFYFYCETSRIEASLIEVNKQLSALSKTDGLTNLPNIRAFRSDGQREWGAALRTEKRLAVLMIDIDDFKLLNDSYGHPAGDGCLIKVAAAIEENVRDYLDYPARYGGEEFIVLMTGVTPDDAMKMGERIRQSVQHIQASEFIGEGFQLSCSIGVALVKPSVDESMDQLISNADKALYAAKHAGKNCVKLSGC